MRFCNHLIPAASLLLAFTIASGCSDSYDYQPRPSSSDLAFDSLATRWDEAIPLGNATVGTLVWRKGDRLRMSLDRTDLWDLRANDSLSGPNFNFDWVKDHIRRGDYTPVQQKLDDSYIILAAPSKIPGAALEFPLERLGEPESVRLYLNDALCEVKWPSGTRLITFVQADEPIGWFRFTDMPDSITPEIIPPVYQEHNDNEFGSDQSGASLERLGYSQGSLTVSDNSAHYHQPGYGDFAYDVATAWERDGSTLTGVWSVTSTLSGESATDEVNDALDRGINADFDRHLDYWDGFYAASSVTLPDSLLQKQYDNEMYKLGSASRENSYPISLQAVWTADDGYLPPWKGDYHHDLNTQLSYWPVYTGNHLSEGLGYLNTIWNQQDTYRRFTKEFFGRDGINIPGVVTLTGEPMGGWSQYSFSQVCSAWIAQHFYKHWCYSADSDFLRDRAYPFAKDVATFIEQQTTVGPDGIRTLEYSTSPEIFDNSIDAWFKTVTNYDLALMRFIFTASAEMADSLGLPDESARWRSDLSQLPYYDLGTDSALTFAKGFPYDVSHRHFSNAMAIHPLGLIDPSNGEADRKIINATIARLDSIGPDYWTGYSYAWLGNMKARNFDGEGAAKALRTFAEAFCLPNTFHANGDQTRSGKSRFTYRPFTLEGNFAFAAGIQEMLLQSHTGVIRIFPAIPADWRDVSFNNLRAEGGILVSAELHDGKPVKATAMSERGGKAVFAIGEKTFTVDLPAGKPTPLPL